VESSIGPEATGEGWAITSMGAGSTSTAVTAANILLTGGALTSGSKSWCDASFSEGISGVQGVIPTIIGFGGASNSTIVVGTGFVVNAPGLTRPAFMNSQVPTG
jgi:hypothetical protein